MGTGDIEGGREEKGREEKGREVTRVGELLIMELGKLATPEETCDEEEAEEEGSEGIQAKKREMEEQYEEEEEKDVKNEEKVSLLEDRMSPVLSCETSSKSPGSCYRM